MTQRKKWRFDPTSQIPARSQRRPNNLIGKSYTQSSFDVTSYVTPTLSTINETVAPTSSAFTTQFIDSNEDVNINEDLTHNEDDYLRFEVDDDLNEIQDDEDNDVDEENEDFVDDSIPSDLSKEELAAAFLACFYSGRTTQQSLHDYIELSNMSSIVKIPKKIDQLAKSIGFDKTKFIHSKVFYCHICIKQFSNKIHRRSCEICNTRLLLH